MSSLKLPAKTKKLTEYEWEGLVSTFNLADGHPRQPLLPEQKRVLQGLFPMFVHAHEGHEPEAKRQFEQAFFDLAGQESVQRLNSPLSQYSGSGATELIVNYLRLHKKRVAFLHPSFDSIADTIQRHGVPLFPLPEEQLYSLDDGAPRLPVDALYIVTPNNPTGRSLTQEQFKNVVAYCRKHHLLLIIDFCFRFYGDFWDYDQYQILQSVGIDFITIEDTGKSWPVADVKLGMVLCNPSSIYTALKLISDDFLLSVSPFVFTLLSAYISTEDRAKRRLNSQDVADTNRCVLWEILNGSPIRRTNKDTRMSVEWLELPAGWKASTFSEGLAQHGVQVLPGERFYWHQHSDGQRYFRIALLREEHYFRKAIERLRKVADMYQP